MKKLFSLLAALIIIITCFSQQTIITNPDGSLRVLCECPPIGCNLAKPTTYIVEPTKPAIGNDLAEIYITNASNRGWKGGDTLKIRAGNYSIIEIDSFGGDPCRDIVIINIGGQVNVTGSIRLQKDIHHVKVLGTGVPGLTYGFKCKNFSFNRANHYLMSNIEVGPNAGGVGIYGKQDPYENQPWTWYPNYTSTKITVTNCYVHDVAGEGMYIGHTYPSGDPAQGNRIPQRMDSVTISNNIVAGTGWDAIQVSNARNGARIFGNTVSNFGIADIDGQRAGIILGGNSSGNVYNNTVTNGTGNGIQFFGYGINKCYGNTITNVGNTLRHVNGEESIYGKAGTGTIEINPRQAMDIYSNQINFPKKWGAIRFEDNNNSEQAKLSNNKFCITNAPTNWKSLYIFVKTPYTDINNITSCR